MAEFDNIAGIMANSKPLPSYAEQQAQASQAQYYGAEAQRTQTQNQQLQYQNQMARFQFQQQQQFFQDMHNMSPTQLAKKWPQFTDQIQASANNMDKVTKQQTQTALSSPIGLMNSNDWDGARQMLQSRLDAEIAAGDTDAYLPHIISLLDQKTPLAREQARVGLGNILVNTYDPKDQPDIAKMHRLNNTPIDVAGGHTLTDPVSQQSFYAPLPDALRTNKFPGGFETQTKVNENALSPGWQGGFGSSPAPGAGDGGAGAPPAAGGAPGTPVDPLAPLPPAVPAGASPKMAAVASVLGGKMPAPVVAGFMGNFHVEGGYDGAQGDGGSSSGVMQLHSPDRVANFQRVMGKPVTEATPAEQAQFVQYEMDHPQEAGMTVAQRDAILAAKTPAQAAALIDKYYERSSGRARKGRMLAAEAWGSASAGAQGAGSQDGGAAQPGQAGGAPVAPQAPSGGSLAYAPGAGQDEPVVNPIPKGFQDTAGAEQGTAWDPGHTGLHAIPGGSADPASWTPGALLLAAHQRMLTGQYPTGSNGPIGSQVKTLIDNMVERERQRIGLSPEDLATIPTRYNADAQSLQQTTSALTGVAKVHTTLNGLLDQTVHLASQLQTMGILTPYPAVNAKKLAFYEHGGGTKQQQAIVQAYLNSVRTSQTDYARITVMSAGGQSGGPTSDSARHDAENYLNEDMAPASIAGGVAQLRRESDVTYGTLQSQHQQLTRRMSQYLMPGGPKYDDPTTGQPPASSPRPQSNAQSSGGLPAGAKQIGTVHGRPVFQLPDGRRIMPK